MSGLYVHVPWCVRKCPYCDFNSHQAKGALPVAEYVQALRTDFAQERERGAFTMRSVYFGGGTPSLFPPAAFETLLDAFGATPNVEVTMEANPGTVEANGPMQAYRDAGINRVSLGAQSFDDAQLRRLGRIHDARDVERAAAAIHAAGFAQFNIDVMFGLPDQTVAQALEDLRGAAACQPTHISWYQLAIEPGTAFARRPPTLPAQDLQADMAEAGQALLADLGFARYEVSAYARPGAQARHNLNYWTFGDYIGIGAGAHGKRSGPAGVMRTAKASAPHRYLKDQSATVTPVDAESLPVEFMMNALRLVDGVPEDSFERRTGLPFGVIAVPVRRLRAEGLLREGRLALTRFGYRHLDEVVSRFL